MPQSAIARRFLAQFSSARQDDERITFISISAIENALESQRDQLPLLVPVALGTGIICWQFGGNAALPAIVCGAAAATCFAAYSGVQYRIARMMLWAALLFCAGFLAISVKSGLTANDALKRPEILTFNGYVESVEDVSARELCLKPAGMASCHSASA
jgi:competence protein ComEC